MNAINWSNELTELEDGDEDSVGLLDAPEDSGQSLLPVPQRNQFDPKESPPLYFDIETVPDHERAELFGLPPFPKPTPETGESDMMSPEEFASQGLSEIQKSLLDRNPVDSWLEQLLEVEQGSKKPRKGLSDAIDKLRKERASVLGAADKRRKQMATTPEMCRIVAIGWAVGGHDPESLVIGEHVTERDLLEKFWELASDSGPIVGFNVADFDLPVVFVRSALQSIPATRLIDTSPYRRDVLDLMVCRFGRGRFGGQLKQLARSYGIEVPAGDVDGSQVEELMQVDPSLVGEYVRSDVEITRALHHFYSGYFCV